MQKSFEASKVFLDLQSVIFFELVVGGSYCDLLSNSDRLHVFKSQLPLHFIRENFISLIFEFFNCI